jgi:hypothetical protein
MLTTVTSAQWHEKDAKGEGEALLPDESTDGQSRNAAGEGLTASVLRGNRGLR